MASQTSNSTCWSIAFCHVFWHTACKPPLAYCRPSNQPPVKRFPKCKNNDIRKPILTVGCLIPMDEYKKKYENIENELRKECPKH